MEKDEACKMDRQNKNTVVLERVREGRIMLELIRKRKKKLAGRLAKKELPAEECSRRGRTFEAEEDIR